MFFERALRDSWAFYSLHFVAFEFIILPVLFPAELLKSVLGSRFNAADEQVLHNLIVYGIPLLAYALTVAALILYIYSIIRKQHLAIPTLWRMGAQRIWSILVLTVLEVFLIGSGLLLFVIPGLLLLCKFAFAKFDVVLNNASPLQALRNSWALTRRSFWLLVSGFLVVVVVVSLLQWFISQVQATLGWNAWWLNAFISSMFMVVWGYFLVYAFYFYAIASVSQGAAKTAPKQPRLEDPAAIRFREFDVVEARRALRNDRYFIPAGTIGAVVTVRFSQHRTPMYEVEFVKGGSSIGILTVRADDLELLESARTDEVTDRASVAT